jgi:hypothetical protein
VRPGLRSFDILPRQRRFVGGNEPAQARSTISTVDSSAASNEILCPTETNGPHEAEERSNASMTHRIRHPGCWVSNKTSRNTRCGAPVGTTLISCRSATSVVMLIRFSSQVPRRVLSLFTTSPQKHIDSAVYRVLPGGVAGFCTGNPAQRRASLGGCSCRSDLTQVF